MADNPADKDELTSSEQEWGADWETAFQAEEDAMFSFDEGEYEALFKQGATPPATGEAPATPSASRPATSEVTEEVDRGPSLASRFFAWLSSLPAAIKGFYTSPQLLTRILAYSIPPVIVCLFLVNLLLPAGDQHRLLPGPEPASQEQPPAGPFTLLDKVELRPPVPQDTPPPAPVSAAPVEQISRKWPFAAFLIPAATENDGQRLAFVEIELALVLLLPPDQPLPEEKKTFLRDIIFQFYSNSPLYDLRRFSLARGEMNRKLRAWIQQQAPELAVQNIIFSHYLVS